MGLLIDREKVIKKAESIICSTVDRDMIDSFCEDVIDLLKEQEPQLVLNIGEQISCKSGSCPKCGKMLNTTCNKRYCGDCGQAVKWE